MKKTMFFGAVIAIFLSACSEPTLQKGDAEKILSKKYNKNLSEDLQLTDESLYAKLKSSQLAAEGYVELPPYSLNDINKPIIQLTEKSKEYLAEHPAKGAKTCRVYIARQVVSEIKSIEIKDKTHAHVRYQVSYSDLTPFAELFPGIAKDSSEHAADFTFDGHWGLSQ
ncbi:hypothetical protein SIO70_26435 [Chitinophaga sancti]|uniref:hypothetical protein n=1 Tax=Chitinophaga sancti TaxID=1004 RepID=UPI002A759E65|nr:hypothetical protein [Chitinophaga sancti]WPQ61904.1 hypothetical protein SIO70_26435 [Chitinophaga sancti]